MPKWVNQNDGSKEMINLDNCIRIYKKNSNTTKKYQIHFELVTGTNIFWDYSTKSERDQEYKRLFSFAR